MKLNPLWKSFLGLGAAQPEPEAPGDAARRDALRMQDLTRAVLLRAFARQLPLEVRVSAPGTDGSAPWQPAERALEVPLGAAVDLRVGVDLDREVLWSGAREWEVTTHSATARAILRGRGRHRVQVEIFDGRGHSRGQASLVLHVDPAATYPRRA